jgi:selenocysteine lyase/cysteine desulfurase
MKRRDFLTAAAVGGGALALPRTAQGWQPPQLARPAGEPSTVAANEGYWRRVAQQYRVTDKVINLEAGYWGMMSIPVHEEYLRHVERVNRESSFYARTWYDTDLAFVRTRVAAFLGVAADEIAFTRSATESLQLLIAGYNRLEPGDAVLYADLDYPAMQNAMKWLHERRGVRVVRITLPEPASRAKVMDAYDSALKANPDVRLVLLTHLNNKTGLLIPVKALTDLARSRGADVIVDAAHSIGQTTTKIPDLGCDFAGFNLHKWIGAPLGVAVIYIKKDRLSAIDRMMADAEAPAESITSRVHTGTTNFAAFLTIPAALDFHEAVGPAHKAARIRYLRDRWVSQVRGRGEIDVLTPDEPDMVAGITSFRRRGHRTRQDAERIVDELLTRHGIFTARRTGVDGGDCVRVTPALYTRLEDVDRLARALLSLA